MADRPKNTVQDAPSLGDLRKDIDRIDEAMHRLLMERGEIINRLISVKNSQETGSAFRPAREADMMRRLVQRHHGILPLDTAESIWRVIIATFTHVQAPFCGARRPVGGRRHDARQRAVSFRLHRAVRAARRRGRRRRSGIGIEGRPRACAGVRHQPRRGVVDRARIRKRAEDHRAAAVHRPRPTIRRRSTCSSSRASPPTPW